MLAKLLIAFLLLQAKQPSKAVADFQEWRSHQPANADYFDVTAHYREHLKQAGLTDEQIRSAFQEIEATRWDRIYSAPNPTFNTVPNAFLMEIANGRKPGRALDIGVGQGRNSIFLAKTGWDVTGFDISEQALKVTQQSAQTAGVKVTTVKASMQEYDFGTAKWDLIVATYEGADWHEKAIRGLKPGGIVVIEGFYRAPGTPPGARKCFPRPPGPARLRA